MEIGVTCTVGVKSLRWRLGLRVRLGLSPIDWGWRFHIFKSLLIFKFIPYSVKHYDYNKLNCLHVL